MLTENQLSLKRTLKQQIIDNNIRVDYVSLMDSAVAFSDIFLRMLTPHQIENVVSELTKEEEVVLTGGGTVYDPNTFRRWIRQRRGQISHDRWSAYEQLLASRDWEVNVIEDLKEQSEEVVELLGDPQDPSDWARRGLLLGEVQSGKTATYIGILNKAIDFGYRLIIVIGGHTNDLRRQTQGRLDTDLIGYDTSRIGKNVRPNARDAIGIAKFNESIRANTLTTVDGDFNKAKADAGLNWIQDTLPTVVVIKKNSRVIQNVTNYIRQQTNGGRLDLPLVLIDDESDWGTPNTGSETDPTQVNHAIRGLLGTSRRSSYLGITATPFANIFIDHLTEHDEIGQDLFPADYIRVMNTPSNYHGIDHYFDGPSSSVRTDVDDCMMLLPVKHKKAHRMTALPDSLGDAIISFYLGTAIRSRRRDSALPSSSMLVNVSRFNDVQANVRDLIVRFADEVHDCIVSEFARESGTRLSPLGQRIVDVWSDSFVEAAAPIAFSSVLSELVSISHRFRVELVNSATAISRAKHRRMLTREQKADEDSRPTIFVGGDVLARGLTLEGLLVSYFVREPRTMDTLMQMGRWFGYRPGYADLVRIWMPNSTRADFEWSAETSAELRELLVEMRAKELTPRDFGLRVRAHPGTFGIVAANKLQSAELVAGDVLLEGNKFESYYLDVSSDVRRANREAAAELLGQAIDVGQTRDTFTGYHAWSGIGLEEIEKFFAKFRADSHDPFFGYAPGREYPQIADKLGGVVGAEAWDVVLIHGDGDSVEATPGLSIGSSIRNSMTLHGTTIELGNRRLATGSNLVGALTDEDRDKLYASLPVGAKVGEARALRYFARPTLLMYFITTTPGDGAVASSGPTISKDDPLVSVVLTFPALEPEAAQVRVKARKLQKFWVNRVWWDSVRGYVDDGDDIDVEELA